MKFTVLICFFLALTAWAAPMTGGDYCQNGNYVNQYCCVKSKQDWFIGTVPLHDVDYVQIMPYTCANPSYCAVMQYSHQQPSPQVGSCGPSCIAAAKAAYHPDYTDTNRFYSGAQYSCGDISFILCKHLGDGDDWQCYAKMTKDDITLKFTQPLKCDYHTNEDGMVSLIVGSCVINQQTVLMQGPFDRTYADLSTNETLSFVPILNPNAVDAFRSQSGINRVIRRSDIVMMTAYLPAPSNSTLIGVLGAMLTQMGNEADTLRVIGGCIIGFFFLFIILMLVITSVLIMMWRHFSASRIASTITDNDDDAEEEPVEMVPVTMVPVAYTQNVYPSSVPLDFFDIPEKLVR